LTRATILVATTCAPACRWSALTARARFAPERFSDVYLVTWAVSAHVVSAASRGRASFALSGRERQLRLTIGPLRLGAGASCTANPEPQFWGA
jgi:hypothetical protein